MANQLVYFGEHVGGIYIEGDNDKKNLYSDAATTCVICFIWGKVEGVFTVIYAHLNATRAIKEFFRRVDEYCFGKTIGELDVYAIGGARVNNCGIEMAELFLDKLNAMKTPKNFLSNDKVGRQDQHWLGFDCHNKQVIHEKFNLEKEADLNMYGPQCTAFMLHSNVALVWMDNSFEIDQSQVAQNSLIYLANKLHKSRNELLKNSTSPTIEPEEYFQNIYTGGIYALRVLEQILQAQNGDA